MALLGVFCVHDLRMITPYEGFVHFYEYICPFRNLNKFHLTILWYLFENHTGSPSRENSFAKIGNAVFSSFKMAFVHFH